MNNGERRLNRRKWPVMATVLGIEVCSGMVYTLQAPFFPAEAESKGTTQIQYGFVFGVYELAALIFSFPLGSLMDRLGSTHVFKCGLLFLSGSTMLFGCLTFIDHSQLFLAFAFIIRIFEAFGQTCINTSLICILQNLYPSVSSSVVAWSETAYGIGMIVGPSLGGILFDLGKFPLPFVAMGVSLLLLLIPALFTIPDDLNNEKRGINVPVANGNSTLQILKIPKIWVGFTANAIGMICSLGFLQSTLEPHLRHFNLSGTVKGAIFLLSGFGYTVSNPIWGILCDKNVSPLFLMIVGGIINVVGLGLVGPIPWIPEEPKLSFVIVGILFTGIGMGGNFIPSLSQLTQSCEEKHIPNTMFTKGVISSLWIGAFNFGGFVGPSLGGILSTHLGFRLASFVIIAVNIVFMVIIVPLAFIDCFRKAKPLKAQMRTSDSTPLLDDPQTLTLENRKYRRLDFLEELLDTRHV